MNTGLDVWPRTYRTSMRWSVFLTVGSVAMIAGGGMFAHSLFAEPAPAATQWVLAITSVALMAMGCYVLLSTHRSKVVLYPDRIEVIELTNTAVLSREEIRGWRILATSPPAVVLARKGPGGKDVKFAQIFRMDSAFQEWLATLPSLDREETRTSQAAIRRNPAFGATPGDRMRALANGRRLAKLLNIAVLLVAGWALLFPVPYVLAIGSLAILPWLSTAIVARSRGLFRADGERNDIHPNVAIGLISPGMVLMFRSTFDFNLIQSIGTVWVSMAGGGLLTWAVLAADQTIRRSRLTAVIFASFAFVYGYGVGIHANVLFDSSDETNYTALVAGKQVITGQAARHELILGGWGPKPETNELTVGRATYEAIAPGDLVHIALKRGALGIKWYYFRSWERSNPR